jgi:hypothetical protein
MKSKLIAFISVLCIMVVIASCSKGLFGSLYPSLVITSPVQAQNYASGARVHITGTATASGTDDAHLLHELSITVTKVSDGSQVWMSDISVHNDQSFTIDTSFTLPYPSVRDSFVVKAQVVNHMLNTASQDIGFTVNP